MFRFNFDIDGAEAMNAEDMALSSVNHEREDSIEARQEVNPPSNVVCSEHSISKLIETLPSRISYTPSLIPSSSLGLKLARRDLFDARFQIIANADDAEMKDEENETQAKQFIDAPSDLVPGIYEGGLKTWECSLDLVSYMSSGAMSEYYLPGKRVLELGCGTGLPSVYLIQKVFRSSQFGSNPAIFYLQDYNLSVLQLVTLPNIILAWYFSPASDGYKKSSKEDHPTEPPDDGGELSLDSELLDAFLSSLAAYHVQLRFFSGDWATFLPVIQPGDTPTFDLILTSETIYRTSSLPSLISILKRLKPSSEQDSQPSMALVAAKILYFGVGGGVAEFSDEVLNAGGRIKNVWESNTGVGRRILSVQFG
ncbi:hypothetical protein FRC02_004057 [Tulasnella sp. 418]|nr:hypothetical protein FRC02_004057 [Tulasnella sp. 418]